MSKKSFSYKDSGVDIKAGEELVDSIKGVVKETHNKNVLTNIGGFGALFNADFSSYKEPVLVSSVDGVGTKLIVAFKAGKYDTVGQDLVNHCVNDIAVCGATPGKDRRSPDHWEQYLCVDHCHDTGQVRGLLCNRCNLVVSRSNTPEYLEAAAAYLRGRGHRSD